MRTLTDEKFGPIHHEPIIVPIERRVVVIQWCFGDDGDEEEPQALSHILPARANSNPHSAKQSAEEVDTRHCAVGIAAAVALAARVSIVAALAQVVLFANEADCFATEAGRSATEA
jgi:hypothetical protein